MEPDSGMPTETKPAAANATEDATAGVEIVEQDLRKAVAGFLEVGPGDVEFETDLIHLGFDSISLVYLVAQIGVLYDIELAVEIVFEYPTLKDLTRYLTTEHASAVAERIGCGDS
ncbi:acyl carrier protein [Streptomyces vinaceus]|uniref:acyl carrier protein n=1 Tax=Streptomyces vinaceus TaxID=1960 RepID=UPI0036A3914B